MEKNGYVINMRIYIMMIRQTIKIISYIYFEEKEDILNI